MQWRSGRDDDGVWEDAFASKPAPTGFWAYMLFVQRRRSLWERACSRWRWVRHR